MSKLQGCPWIVWCGSLEVISHCHLLIRSDQFSCNCTFQISLQYSAQYVTMSSTHSLERRNGGHSGKLSVGFKTSSSNKTRHKSVVQTALLRHLYQSFSNWVPQNPRILWSIFFGFPGHLNQCMSLLPPFLLPTLGLFDLPSLGNWLAATEFTANMKLHCGYMG